MKDKTTPRDVGSSRYGEDKGELEILMIFVSDNHFEKYKKEKSLGTGNL